MINVLPASVLIFKSLLDLLVTRRELPSATDRADARIFNLSKFRHFITKSTAPGRLEDSKIINVLPASIKSNHSGSRLPDAAYDIYLELLILGLVIIFDHLSQKSTWKVVNGYSTMITVLPASILSHESLLGRQRKMENKKEDKIQLQDTRHCLPPALRRKKGGRVQPPGPPRPIHRAHGHKQHPTSDSRAPRSDIDNDAAGHQRSLYSARIASFVAHRQTQPYAREGKGDIYLVASVLNSDIRDFRRHRITAAALLEKVAFKGGHTKHMARRQREYGKCEGRTRTLIWICRYTVQRRYYCERLFHLRLFKRGGERDVHKCTCKVAHREFLTFPSIGGLAQVDATMKKVLRAMGERIRRTFFSPSFATKDIYQLILQS
ncbi:hypothetical protein B0H11DRAFT_1945722 [Mycena galericulata]|nr:hypothetical protein B0H11DRAFT_1945722 [Mycena galericulata]